jgi:hypothetical protein
MQRKNADPVDVFDRLDCFLFLAVHRTAKLVEQIDKYPNKTISDYACWIQKQSRLYETSSVPNFRPEWSFLRDDDEYFDKICSEMPNLSKLGNLRIRIWENMPSILSGQLDSLSLLFQDDLLSETYQELNSTSNWLSSLTDITKHLAHLNGSMRILEVGAGTGATTRVILDAISSFDGPHYDFTDISPGFFEKAKESFGHFPSINFLTLDIEKNPPDQGFILGSYDINVASLVCCNGTVHYQRQNLRLARFYMQPKTLTQHENTCDRYYARKYHYRTLAWLC